MLPRKELLRLFKEGCWRELEISSSGSPGRGELLGERNPPLMPVGSSYLPQTPCSVSFSCSPFSRPVNQMKDRPSFLVSVLTGEITSPKGDYFKPALEIMFGFFTLCQHLSSCTAQYTHCILSAILLSLNHVSCSFVAWWRCSRLRDTEWLSWFGVAGVWPAELPFHLRFPVHQRASLCPMPAFWFRSTRKINVLKDYVCESFNFPLGGKKLLMIFF